MKGAYISWKEWVVIVLAIALWVFVADRVCWGWGKDNKERPVIVELFGLKELNVQMEEHKRAIANIKRGIVNLEDAIFTQKRILDRTEGAYVGLKKLRDKLTETDTEDTK